MTEHYTYADLRACLSRELSLRAKVYPGRVASGMMTEGEAAREKAMMKTLISIIDILRTPLITTGMLDAGTEALELAAEVAEEPRERAREVWVAMAARLPTNLQEQP
jgi:hypothetical protein